jgi:hypothetical protein
MVCLTKGQCESQPHSMYESLSSKATTFSYLSWQPHHPFLLLYRKVLPVPDFISDCIIIHSVNCTIMDSISSLPAPSSQSSSHSSAGPMNQPQIPAAESPVWTRKFLLSLGVYSNSTKYKLKPLYSETDGGGVRGYSTLLILQELMKICGSLEMRDDPGATSSYHPIPFQIQQDSYVTKTQSPRSSRYLPVHYFDYIG